MKRRILSILLLAALVLGLLPQRMLSVSAYSETDIAYPVEGGNLYFDKATGTITDCDNSVTGADIPAEIDGAAVTGIGSNAFKDCANLISVTLPKRVTSIGDNAFSGCTYLSSTCDGVQGVIIPANVTSIGSLAFFGCECLQSVYFEGDAPEIGENVFTIKDPDSLWVDDIYVEYINIPGLTLYYIDGCTGWSFETWNGYHTMLWSGDPMNPEYPPLEPTEPTEPTEPEDFTAYPVEGGNLYFYSADGTIVDCDETVTYADVPAEIDGIAVTGIGSSAFEYCISLTCVTLPESVTSIDSYAFEGCESLQSACFLGDAPALGTDVFCMEKFVFDSDFGVDTETVVIPGLTLYYIDGKADWTRPTWNGYPTATWDGVNVPVAYSVEGGNLYFNKSTGEIYDCDETVTAADIPTEIDGVAVTGIGYWAFESCHGLVSVTIPNSVTNIKLGAFGYCSRLTSVTIPNSVTSIGRYAFVDCSSLVSVTIPDSVTSIGDSAFAWCSSLTSVTIPDSVTSIGDSVFGACGSLTAINVAEKNTEYASENGVLFNKSRTILLRYPMGKTDTEYSVPNSVTSIYTFAFSDCSSLTSVTIPDSVTNIGDYAFCNCGSLQSVCFIGDAPALGENVFSIWNDEAWAYVNIPNLILYYIEGKADWTTPTWNGYPTATWDGVNVPEPADEIAYPVEGGNLYFRKSTGEIFDCDTTVTNADIPEKIAGVAVTTIGDHAFSYCSSMESVTIPDSVTSIGGYAFSYCSSLESVTIPGSVTSISDRTFYWCDNLTTMTILEGVTSIGGLAFGHCTGLTSVTIPDSVTSIGMSAFDNCSSLTSVTIPESVTSIGERAFCDCSSLTAIHVAEGNTAYTSENGVLFDKNKTLLHTYPAGKTESEYIIPESVISIGSHAFYRCSNLTNVTIPVGVTSIVNYAFFMCSSLTSVTIPEGVKSISKYAFYGCSSLTSVTIPEGVKSIGISAFDACSSLTSVTIPGSVTSISERAFYACGSLQSLYFMGAAPALEAYAFSLWNAETQTYINNPNLILYYIDGKEGWTTPTWNSYPTATWMPVHEHSYVVVVTAPTCTEQGCTTHTCSICCDTYTDTYTEALGHDYGEWTPIKAATCTEKGEEERTCSRCYSFETRETDATGHTEVVDAAVPATCTEDGKTEGKHCDLCGTVIVAQETVAALGHDFGEWTQTKAPTCTEKGEEKCTCSRCDAFETREIAAHGHTEVIDAAVPATCTEDGKTEGKHCDLCGTVIVAQETVPAMGHSFKDGVCTVCGAKDPDAQPAAPAEFSDVSEKAWYYEAVEYAVEKGLMNGVGGGNFDPEGTMTRAMLVTVLWRYEGEPAEGENTFTDVPNGTWYTEAVAWAAANGIVGGVGNGKFDPEGSITREQMAAILFRYAGKKCIDTSKRGDLSGFPDSGKISAWAKDAMQWTVAEQIINGSDGKLLPQGNATRAQVATILMRFLENIVKA
ncbi:MAG: leucine-rich repeat protein [Faecousia sp.]